MYMVTFGKAYRKTISKPSRLLYVPIKCWILFNNHQKLSCIIYLSIYLHVYVYIYNLLLQQTNNERFTAY